MAEKQTVAKWEQQKNMMIENLDAAELKQDSQVTEEEFLKACKNNSIGVMYSDRIAFLNSRGHQLTRTNMMNADL